jgi:hypothetical protein
MIRLICLFGIILGCNAQCYVETLIYFIYPTSTENIAVEMSTLFVGTNLTYGANDNPNGVQVYNYFTPIDETAYFRIKKSYILFIFFKAPNNNFVTAVVKLS